MIATKADAESTVTFSEVVVPLDFTRPCDAVLGVAPPRWPAAVGQYRLDVLVVGIRTPRINAEAALSAAQRLRASHPSIGVVVIAEAGDGYALELLRSGAAGVGYLLDDRVGDLEMLLSAIHGAHAGDTVLAPRS